jgi:RNA polymerase sigma-70 factor, ECF subfamily
VIPADQDGQLVQGAKQGSLECFGRLYHRYYQAMAAIAYNVLADHHLVEDAAQETFAIACRDLQTLKCDEKFAAWLAGICRNVAKQMIRSKKELRLFTTEYRPPEQDTCPNDEISVSVRSAIWKLSSSDREVILLRYYQELSYEQMAAVLGISESAVHGRLVRSKQKIENNLKHNGLVKDHDKKFAHE